MVSAERLVFDIMLDRDATPIVDNLDSPVGEKGHFDPGGVSGHRLVDRVVDDLPDEVMEPSRAGGPDVHPGPSLDGLETLEHGDVFGFVTVASGRHDPPCGTFGCVCWWT